MNKIIDITDILAIREVGEILELSKNEARSFFILLKSGNTLAESLRAIGVYSASEVGLQVWPSLRAWRNRYFPNNVKVKC